MRSLSLLLAITAGAVVYVIGLGLTARLVASTAAALSTGVTYVDGGGSVHGRPHTSTSISEYVYSTIYVLTGTTLTHYSTYSSFYTFRNQFNTADVSVESTYRTYTDVVTVHTGDNILPSTAAYWSSISYTPSYSTAYSTRYQTYRVYVTARSEPTLVAAARAAAAVAPQATAAPIQRRSVSTPASHAKRAFSGDPRPRLRAILALAVLMLVCYAALLANAIVCSITVQRAEQHVRTLRTDAARITTPAAYDDVRSAVHKRSRISKSFAGVFAALTVVLLVLGLATFALLGASFGIVGGLAAAAVAFWVLSIVAGVGIIAACVIDIRAAQNEHDMVGTEPSNAYGREKHSSVGHGDHSVAATPAVAAPVPVASAPAPAPAPAPTPSTAPAASSPYPVAGTMYMAMADGRGGTVMVPVQQSE